MTYAYFHPCYFVRHNARYIVRHSDKFVKRLTTSCRIVEPVAAGMFYPSRRDRGTWAQERDARRSHSTRTLMPTLEQIPIAVSGSQPFTRSRRAGLRHCAQLRGASAADLLLTRMARSCWRKNRCWSSRSRLPSRRPGPGGSSATWSWRPGRWDSTNCTSPHTSRDAEPPLSSVAVLLGMHHGRPHREGLRLCTGDAAATDSRSPTVSLHCRSFSRGFFAQRVRDGAGAHRNASAPASTTSRSRCRSVGFALLRHGASGKALRPERRPRAHLRGTG